VATESIGTLIPTAIPGYTDSADIQAALRAYHYGSYAYDPANTSAASLVSPSIAKTIYDITTDITALENRPSSGGEVNTVQPAATSFTPPEIPDGFIWVDEDGTIGGLPISATAIFTNSAPTTSLTTGVIWVDKDAESITANPFIPQAVINAKGDLLVGTANDIASVLSVGTTGFFLKANSATTSGLEWAASTADIDGVTAGTGLSGGGTSGTVTLSINTAVTADLTTAQTLTNKTIALDSNAVSGTIAQFNTAVTDADFATVAGNETLTNKTIDASTNTLTGVVTLTGTQTLTNKTLTAPIVNLAFNAQTGTTYTLVAADRNKLVTSSNGAAVTITIPTGVFAAGEQINVQSIGVGLTTISGAAVTITSTGASALAPILRARFSAATIICTAAGVFTVIGDIS